MRIVTAAGVAALATVGLAGCAGVPVVVSAASFYVDTILVLRTNKSSSDHLLSAAMDRDCALTHIFSDGAICKDAPPTPILAAIMREVQTVPMNGAIETAQAPASPPTAPIPGIKPIQVAALPAVTLSDGTPDAGAAPLPERKPPAPKGAVAQAASRAEGGRFLVVVGSFAERSQAEDQRARLAHADAEIVPASVRGRTYHRVVLPPSGRGDALRQVTLARRAGIEDAWLLPWSGRFSVDTAVASLPMVGFLYRM